MRVFDKANNIGQPTRALAIAFESYQSGPGRRADRLSQVIAPARSQAVLIAVIRASIAAARRNFRRPRDTSRQIRSQERWSREQSRHSARTLKSETIVILEDLSAWQVSFSFEHVRFLRQLGANSGIWQWNDRIQELRLPPNFNFLLEIVGKPDQLSLAQRCAVHQHPGRPARVANTLGERQVWITCHGGPR